MSDPNMISIRGDLANFLSEELDMEVSMDLKTSLRSGVILCCLFKKIVPNVELGKWFMQPGEKLTLYNCNLRSFEAGCKQIGITDNNLLKVAVFETKNNDDILERLLLFLRTVLNQSVINDTTMQNIRRIISNYDHCRRRSLTKTIEETPPVRSFSLFNIQSSPFSPNPRKSNRVVSEEQRKLLLEKLEKKLDDEINSVVQEPLTLSPVKEPAEVACEKVVSPPAEVVPKKEEESHDIPAGMDMSLLEEKENHIVDFDQFEHEMGICKEDYLSPSQLTHSPGSEDPREVVSPKAQSHSLYPSEMSRGGETRVPSYSQETSSQPVETRVPSSSPKITQPVETRVSPYSQETLSQPVETQVPPYSQETSQPVETQVPPYSQETSQPIEPRVPSYPSDTHEYTPGQPPIEIPEMNEMGLFLTPVVNPIERFHLMDLLCAFEEKRKISLKNTHKSTSTPRRMGYIGGTAKFATQSRGASPLPNSYKGLHSVSLSKPVSTPKAHTSKATPKNQTTNVVPRKQEKSVTSRLKPQTNASPFSPLQKNKPIQKEFSPIDLSQGLSSRSKLATPMVLRYPMMADYKRLGKSNQSAETAIFEGKSKIPMPRKTINTTSV